MSGGVASATKILGGVQAVSSGGLTKGVEVSAGGTQYVSAGGESLYAGIDAGGKERVVAGGVTSDTVIAGGTAYISAGTVSGTTIISGALLSVSHGGVVQAGLTLSGGTAAISGTMSAGQTASFRGAGGDLALYNLSGFAAAISGFGPGDTIDLGGFAYGGSESRSFAEAAGNISGTLKVTDGTQQASLTLLGGYVTSDFALSNDAAGGTFVKFV